MVKTLKDTDLPKPWFGKKSKHVTIMPKQTRAVSKQMAQEQVLDDDVAEEPSAKGEAWDKGKGKEDVAGKGRKKAKAVRLGTADMVSGRSKYVVPDPEELRRKRNADAEACGRVVKSLSKPATRKSCPMTVVVETDEEGMHVELTGGLHNVMELSGSPGPEIPTAQEGIDIHSRERENVDGNDARRTPPGQRPGKEHYHEETQHAQESPNGSQESGKRKAVENARRHSTSSERSNPVRSAQKHRRGNMTPSPVILTSRVSCISMFVMNAEFKYVRVSTISLDLRLQFIEM